MVYSVRNHIEDELITYTFVKALFSTSTTSEIISFRDARAMAEAVVLMLARTIEDSHLATSVPVCISSRMAEVGVIWTANVQGSPSDLEILAAARVG